MPQCRTIRKNGRRCRVKTGQHPWCHLCARSVDAQIEKSNALFHVQLYVDMHYFDNLNTEQRTQFVNDLVAESYPAKKPPQTVLVQARLLVQLPPTL